LSKGVLILVFSNVAIFLAFHESSFVIEPYFKNLLQKTFKVLCFVMLPGPYGEQNIGILHNDAQLNDILLNDAQLNDILHNDKGCSRCKPLPATI
jgi:hypothetical protein